MKIEHHKIARLVLTKGLYGKDGNFNRKEIEKGFNNFLNKTFDKQHFEFLVMAGGVINSNFPDELEDKYSIDELEIKHIDEFVDWGEEVLAYFFNSVLEASFDKLKETVDYFTIGFDCFSQKNKQHIELVAIADVKNEGKIHWTGKFYPIEAQKRSLVKVNDLSSHFVRLNNQNVLVLGCHDLDVFHPRGQANVVPDSYKGKISAKFKRECKKFKPDIVLQHPHSTYFARTWSPAWDVLEKELPSVQHYASGIFYPTLKEKKDTLEKVLEKTKKGDVIDFILM